MRRLLGLKVKRNWHQPAAVVFARATPLCPNLQEHVYHLSDYVEFSTLLLTAFDSPITPIGFRPQLRVRFCWCGLRNPLPDEVTIVYINSGGHQYGCGSTPWLSVRTGCVDVSCRHLSPHPGEDVAFGYNMPPPWPVLHFSDGGGISLQISP